MCCWPVKSSLTHALACVLPGQLADGEVFAEALFDYNPQQSTAAVEDQSLPVLSFKQVGQ